MFAFRDSNRQNKFKDEICTYCDKKGHTETVRFAKCDDISDQDGCKSIAAMAE